MYHSFNTLEQGTLESDVTYQRPPQRLPEIVTLDNAAIDVMTDFSKVAAITMGPCASIDAANERMIASGVKLLLVTDQFNTIVGVITTTDLQGERPMRYLQEVGGKREDILLRDLMTPQNKIEVLSMSQVSNAKVGDIVNTLYRYGRKHALVVENTPDGQIVRGMFSATQLSIQLGVTIDPTEVANSFAEVKAALA